jgi:hypothetical protein
MSLVSQPNRVLARDRMEFSVGTAARTILLKRILLPKAAQYRVPAAPPFAKIL